MHETSKELQSPKLFCKRTKEHILSDFMTYSYQGVWFLHKDVRIVQWNRKCNSEIDPHKYGQLIFDRGTKVIQQRKDSLLNKWP